MAFLVHLVTGILYSKTAGRMPLANMYEFVLLLSLILAGMFLLIYRIIPQSYLGSIIGPMEAVLMAFLITRDNHIQPLIPALQSIWLNFHVALAVMAYGLFTISFAAGLIYLFGSGAATNDPKLEKLITQGIIMGFPFQTLVLITGAIWAEQAWGTWWSWDPKETWALVTWLVYALYLHACSTLGWNGRKAAILSVLGFVTVLFTLFGVTFFLPGLHSYG